MRRTQFEHCVYIRLWSDLFHHKRDVTVKIEQIFENYSIFKVIKSRTIVFNRDLYYCYCHVYICASKIRMKGNHLIQYLMIIIKIPRVLTAVAVRFRWCYLIAVRFWHFDFLTLSRESLKKVLKFQNHTLVFTFIILGFKINRGCID